MNAESGENEGVATRTITEQLSIASQDLESARRDTWALLSLVADIRSAVGDPKGELMQDELVARCCSMRDALEKLRDCDWVISLPNRMDAVREIARKALETPSQRGGWVG